MQGTWVQFLVRKLRSHMQQGVANEKRKLQMAGNNNIIFPREQKQANENSPDMEVESASYSVCHRTHT